MSRTLGLALAALAAPVWLHAQDTLRLDDLRPPAAPAFVLLGVAPTEITRPTSPRALAVNLASTAAAQNVLPKDYALEVTPYWLLRHPGLTFDEYYHPTIPAAILQSLAFSVGTTALPDTLGGGTAVGVGVRTSVIPGRPHPALAQAEQALRAVQDTMNRLRSGAEDSIEAMLRTLEDSVFALGLPAEAEGRVLDSLTTARTAAHDSAVARSLQAYEESARGIARAMQALDKERVGWQVELASALVLDYPGDLTDSGRVGRIGVWVTGAHRMPAANLELVGVARYRHERRTTAVQNLLDYGLRLAWESENVILSGEFLEHVGGTGAAATPGYRLAANLEYRVGPWGSLTATVGNDDQLDGQGRQRLVTTLGFNLGFGVLPLLVGSQ